MAVKYKHIIKIILELATAKVGTGNYYTFPHVGKWGGNYRISVTASVSGVLI